MSVLKEKLSIPIEGDIKDLKQKFSTVEKGVDKLSKDISGKFEKSFIIKKL